MAENSGLKVFISWSGDLAKEVATQLRTLVPVLFDGVTPWMSDQDIEAGSRGLEEIARQLDGTSFGIIVVTNANQHSQWLNFEAGALSKRVGDESKVRVVPLLVDLSSGAELTGPMVQFQWKLLDRMGVRELFVDIGGAAGVSAEVVERRLDAEWEKFEAAVHAARSRSKHPSQRPRRTVESMVEETLELVRGMAAVERPVSASAQNQHNSTLNFMRDVKTQFAHVSPQIDLRVRREQDGLLVVELDDPAGVLDVGDSSVYESVQGLARGYGFNTSRLAVMVNGRAAVPF